MTKIRAKTRDTGSELPTPQPAQREEICGRYMCASGTSQLENTWGGIPASWAMTGSSEAIGAVETPTGPHGGCDQRTP